MADESLDAISEQELAAMAERLETLPEDVAEWVVPLFLECQRARDAEARLAAGHHDDDATRIVLDTADWLRTLWEVGYMGAEAFPAPPRSAFPTVSVEDILKSALFARIRCGKRPLPFPPPTRNGVPWHELVESAETFAVRAQVDPDGVTIEGCHDWQRVDGGAGNCLVQHRGKGPIYLLVADGDGGGTLRRQPPGESRRLLRQSRAGISAYLLEWPKEDGGSQRVPLRAADWERAENEALRWVALHYPNLYGQIRFERHEL